ITVLRGAARPEAAAVEQRDWVGDAIELLEEGRARGLAEAAGRRSADLASLSDVDRRRYIEAVEAVAAIEAMSRQISTPLVLQAEASAANERLKDVVNDVRERQRAQGKDFLPEPDTSLPTVMKALQRGEALVYVMPIEVGTLLIATGPSGQ